MDELKATTHAPERLASNYPKYAPSFGDPRKLGLTTVQERVRAIPLILPNDHAYDPTTMSVQKRRGVARKSLYVVPEAIEMIRRIKVPLSVLGICGPARTGKSYILSRMLGKADAFPLAHSNEPGTVGIWVYGAGTQILKGTDTDNKEFGILLLDTEGTGSLSKEQDANIFVLATLLCSQLIYNSLSQPTKNDLDKNVFSLASRIKQKDKGANNEDAASFVWLMRDLNYAADKDSQKIKPTPYIREKVFGLPSYGDTTAGVECQLFTEIEGFTLPRPHLKEDFIEDLAKHELTELMPMFRRGVHKFAIKMTSNCSKKLTRRYKEGVILASMIEEYVNAINDPNKRLEMTSIRDVKPRLPPKVTDIQDDSTPGTSQTDPSGKDTELDKIYTEYESPHQMKISPNSQVRRYFGVSLEDLAKKEGDTVPTIVRKICEFTQKNGIGKEGIFRVSGNLKVKRKLKDSFEKSGDADFEEADDAMAVACLLKQFLRELSDPVVPDSMKKQFVSTQEDSQDKNTYTEKTRLLLAKLPKPNYDLLKFLCHFLKEVSTQEDTNKMNCKSLGTVFGPNLFKFDDGIEALKEQGVTNNIVSQWIVNYDALFVQENGDSPNNSKLIKTEAQGHKPQATITPRAHIQGHRLEQLRVPGLAPDQKQVTAIPLILPNDHKYDPSTMKVEKKEGVKRTYLEVVPEAVEMICSIKEPVSVLAICGPTRTGKSYILSRILGKETSFAVGHHTEPKTFGIWVGTQVLKGKNKKGEDFCLLLLDTEGTDDVKAAAENDAGVFVLTILLCTQLVYNSKGTPTKTHLNKLEHFTTLASKVYTTDDKKVTVADTHYFPNFLWLLRDFSSLLPEDKEGNAMSPTDYIKQEVLGASDDQGSATPDYVAKVIWSLFPEIEAFTLPTPNADPRVLQKIEKHTQKLSHEFNKGVQELVKKLISNCGENLKRGYRNASTVTGDILGCMIKAYVEAVNGPSKSLAIGSIWENVVANQIEQIMETLVTKYKDTMQNRISAASHQGGADLPLEEDVSKGSEREGLLAIHKSVFDDINEELLEKIRYFGDTISGESNDQRQIICTFQEKLVEYKSTQKQIDQQNYSCDEICGGELNYFLKRNRKLSEKYCKEIYLRLFKPIEDKTVLGDFDYKFEGMMQAMDQFYMDYDQQAKGPAKLEVKKELDAYIFERQKKYLEKLTEQQKQKVKAEQEACDRQRVLDERVNMLSKINGEGVMKQQQQKELLLKLKKDFERQKLQMEEREKERRKGEQTRIQDLYDVEHYDLVDIVESTEEQRLRKYRDVEANIKKNEETLMKELREKLKQETEEEITRRVQKEKEKIEAEMKKKKRCVFM